MKPKLENIKREILYKLLEIRTVILQAASEFSPTAQNTVFLGVWTIKDLLAHLIGWDFTNLAAVNDI